MLTDFVIQQLESQKCDWTIARQNFEALHHVEQKVFVCGASTFIIQHNPTRAISSSAKTDAKSIAARPCFLCKKNRPEEQTAITWKDYEILVNPFPIFNQHLTIALRRHQPQQIANHLDDMLQLALELNGFTIFYNGGKCGASAPDHMHFQAGETEKFPIISDFKREQQHLNPIQTNYNTQLYRLSEQDFFRTIWIIKGTDATNIRHTFLNLFPDIEKEEPMMNLLCHNDTNNLYLYIFPRKAFRPWQYNAEGNEKLLISPAAVEMSGLFIAPRKEDFLKISKEDIASIFQQITWHE
ncbi:MAG: DUF4922 domain-containing protein [Bacteroidales bacterium]|nr:DUF4922 domain-containing protein [Bacteroidales bacterium]